MGQAQVDLDTLAHNLRREYPEYYRENSGWGIHLYRASHSVITHNTVDHTLRCPAATDCGAAAILVRGLA